MISSPGDAFVLKSPFAEQLDFFRQKLNLPSERWDDIHQSGHDRAFIVAGAQTADLVQDFKNAIDKVIAEGKSYGWFQKNFEAIVKRHGWTGWTGEGSQAGRDWRTRVIYSTNLSTSYAAGRWAQLNHPDLVKLRPYWRYVHADGIAHPRPLHQSWNGLVLPRDHPFWKLHFPPQIQPNCHCHCRVVAASEAEYQAAVKAGRAEPPEGWQEVDAIYKDPDLVARGWDFAPGANANRPLKEFIDQKLITLDAPIGAAMWRQLKPALIEEQARAFAGFVDATLAGPPRGRLIVAGVLESAWIDAAAARGIRPATADISVRDADVWHTFRDGKPNALDLDWYKRLPEHLATPDAVILDTTHEGEPAFLLLYDVTADATAKLVVRVNYRIKKAGDGNIVQTGKAVDRESVRGMIGHGYTLVEGRL